MNDEKIPTNQENEVESKRKDDTTVRRIVLIVITTIIILSTIGVFSVYSYVKSSLGPVDEENKEVIAVNIPLGSSSSQIAEILEDSNLIKDARIFKLYLKFKNAAEFQAGEYELTPSYSIDEIIEELQTGKIMEEALFAVTIPEGKNLEQIAEIFSKRFEYIKEEDFIKKTEDKDFLNEMKTKYPTLITEEIFNKDIMYPLEGYLFAGTYDFFEEEPTISEIIDMMLARTNAIINSFTDEMETSEFNVHELLTLSSVIEREAKFPEDRPKVSQVYINRLNEGMRLQSDITAFYGIDHKALATYDDIEIDTPYNTYVIDGLPVGPINSPSNESISAVMQPEGEEFTQIYYFSRPNGETFYSSTLDEHNEVKKQYRQEWYDLEVEEEKDTE